MRRVSDSFTPKDSTETTALADARAAYRGARGVSLPAMWVRAVLTDCRTGGADNWIGLTADDVTAAHAKLAADKQINFAPWHVTNYVGSKASTANTAAKHAAAVAASQQQADAAAARRQDERREQEKYFDGLTVDDQAELRIEANRRCRYHNTPEVVELHAVQLAWRRKQENSPCDTAMEPPATTRASDAATASEV